MTEDSWSKLTDINLNNGSWGIGSISDCGPNGGKSVVNGPFGSDLLTSELRDEGVPVIYSGDFRGGRYVRKKTSKCFVSEEKAASLLAFQTLKGDVILAKVGDPPGSAAVYNDNQGAVVTQDVIRIRPSSGISSGFLSALLNSDIGKRQVHRIKISGTRSRVSLTDFKKMKLPLPPLPEQRKIADILSTWDRAIETSEALLATARSQKRALMQALLTGKRRFPEFEGQEWKQVRLGEMGKTISGGTPDSTNPEFWEGDVHWATPTDITKLTSRFIRGTARMITQAGLKDSSAKLVPSGSILICTRATIGEMAIATGPICTNQGFKNLVPSKDYDSDFLFYLLQFFKNDMIRYASGSTFLELSKKDFDKRSFMVPALSEQRRIAAVLNASEEEIDEHRQSIDKLRTEKKALMQQLLTGKRRVMV